jgi:hypothetical protein
MDYGTIAGEYTQLGGEIQMWLALAYSANSKEDLCISMYKRLAEQHPNPRIRRQAKDLCYIMEAPKMERSADERVSLPVLDLDPNSYVTNRYLFIYAVCV